MRDGADIVGRVGLSVMGGLATFGERLFEGLFGHSAPRRRAPRPPGIRPVPPPANDPGETVRRAAEIEAEDTRRRAAWWDARATNSASRPGTEPGTGPRGHPGSPETRRAQTRVGTDHAAVAGRRRDARIATHGPREAWTNAAVGKLPRGSVDAMAIGSHRGADRRDKLFDKTVADILRLGPGTSAPSRRATAMMSVQRAADTSASPLTLRQRLTEQGAGIIDLILQPKLIYPDAPLLPALQAEPDAPTDGGWASADRAERSAIVVGEVVATGTVMAKPQGRPRDFRGG